MNPIQIILIAVGLSADAFAVSVAEGVALHKVTRNHVLRISLHFGLFQAVMPVIGWLAGSGLRRFVAAWDHWVAFGILTFIGGKMLLDVLFKFETGETSFELSGEVVRNSDMGGFAVRFPEIESDARARLETLLPRVGTLKA